MVFFFSFYIFYHTRQIHMYNCMYPIRPIDFSCDKIIALFVVDTIWIFFFFSNIKWTKKQKKKKTEIKFGERWWKRKKERNFLSNWILTKLIYLRPRQPPPLDAVWSISILVVPHRQWFPFAWNVVPARLPESIEEQREVQLVWLRLSWLKCNLSAEEENNEK